LSLTGQDNCRPPSAATNDALCERYGIDNTHRTPHGALLDAELLAEVYLAMTRGQDSLVMELGQAPARATAAGSALSVLVATEEEAAEHATVLADIERESKGQCVWLSLGDGTGPA